MKNLSKRDWSILVANALDHFDTALYSFLAPVFAPSFFPDADPLVSIIMAYSVLATSVVTRPLGSYIFGIMAIKMNPSQCLYYSLLGVGITTFLMGILPDYNSLGVFAPFLLIVLRFFNGFFAAGENSLAGFYIFSNRSNIQARKNSYLYETSVMVGIVLASILSHIVMAFGENNNYWRSCFIFGGVIALAGYILRASSAEEELEVKKVAAPRSFYDFSGFSIIWRNKFVLIKIAVIYGFSYVTYSMPFIVMDNLLPYITSHTKYELMAGNNILLILDMVLLPVIGIFLVKYPSHRILVSSASLLALTIIPIFNTLGQASGSYIFLVKLWIVVIGVAFAGQINVWLNGLISKTEKYLLTGMGSSIGSAAIGKLTPVICLFLYHKTGSLTSIAIYIAVISILALWAVISLESTSSSKPVEGKTYWFRGGIFALKSSKNKESLLVDPSKVNLLGKK